jgi:hypothetical protein
MPKHVFFELAFGFHSLLANDALRLSCFKPDMHTKTPETFDLLLAESAGVRPIVAHFIHFTMVLNVLDVVFGFLQLNTAGRAKVTPPLYEDVIFHQS